MRRLLWGAIVMMEDLIDMAKLLLILMVMGMVSQ